MGRRPELEGRSGDAPGAVDDDRSAGRGPDPAVIFVVVGDEDDVDRPSDRRGADAATERTGTARIEEDPLSGAGRREEARVAEEGQVDGAPASTTWPM